MACIGQPAEAEKLYENATVMSAYQLHLLVRAEL